VADLLTVDSTQVCEDSWLGVRNSSRQSEYHWPRTKKPAERHWALWRQALTKVLDVSSYRSTAWNLGLWKCDSISRWNWLLDPSSGELFHLEGSVWVIWQPMGRLGLRSTSHTFSKGHMVSRLPTQLLPVSVRRLSQRHKVQVTGVARLPDAISEDTPMTTFLERLQWFGEHNSKDSWILDELELVGTHCDIIRSIKDGTACAISDGSFNKTRAGPQISRSRVQSRKPPTRGNIRCKARRRQVAHTAVKCQASLVLLPWSTSSVNMTASTREALP
jgi:hypothetical protein